MKTEAMFVKRRSIYNLGNQPIMTQDEIVGLIKNAVMHAPTAFNSQSARVIVLFGEAYRKLWEITMKTLHKVTPPEKLENMIVKISSFQKGLGTILFFEDESIIRSLQAQYPLYAENFPLWAQQSNGMLQYMIWAALSEHDIGASLQHYNPLIDDAVREEYTVSADWKLVAQMPFGSIAAPAGDKTFQPLDERVKVFD